MRLVDLTKLLSEFMTLVSVELMWMKPTLLVGKINREIRKSPSKTQAKTILPLASTMMSGIPNISHFFESWRCLQDSYRALLKL